MSVRKLAKTTRSGAPASAAPALGAPPKGGPISRMVRGARRLVRAGSRATADATATERKSERVPDARRSAIDAGLTGGISLLFGGGDDRRRG